MGCGLMGAALARAFAESGYAVTAGTVLLSGRKPSRATASSRCGPSATR
ncbi:hypothetical protein ACH4UR_25570 [Streptomyces lydicus]